MLISRTPLRISLGGGGTDLPFYYKRNGGFVVAAGIKKYIFITVSHHFEKIIKLNYSRTEICNSLSEIKHPIIREALKLLDIKNHIEINSIADLPSKAGLGSSGSFAVGLLNALQTYTGKNPSKKKLADLACHIEIDLLKKDVGKQDQYTCAFGGFQCISINKQGQVCIKTLKISEESKYDLEHNLIFFYTGIRRSAGKILTDQKINFERKNYSFESLDKIKKIGLEIKRCLEKDNLDEFGRLLDDHWLEKKKTSKKISNYIIDKYYEIAKMNGALGGKIIGAGGGGFLMFYCNNKENKNKIRKEFSLKGLNEVRCPFESEGTKIILNLKGE